MDADGTLMRDIVGWDVRTWAHAVQFWDDELGTPNPALDCLELGAGPGGPSLWLALKGQRVVCSNWANAEADASPLHRRYNVTSISYQDIDARAIDFENHFDIIVFKSVLGGVGSDGGASQRLAMREILKALKPGGRLLFAENIRGTVFHRMIRAFANRRRRASWYYMPLPELTALLADFAEVQLHTTGATAVFGVTEGQRRALATLDKALVPLTPPRWRYMAYGVARKAS